MTRKTVVQGTTVIPDKADQGGRDPESRGGCLNLDSPDSRIFLILHHAHPGILRIGVQTSCWIPASAGMLGKGVVQGTAVIPDKADEGGRDPEARGVV